MMLTFDPSPDVWTFDDTRGTRELLREQIHATLTQFLTQASPDARLDGSAQSEVRSRVRALLLHWIGFRGLHIPAGG